VAITDTTNPVVGELTVQVKSNGQIGRAFQGSDTQGVFTRMIEYEYSENWLEPSDHFSFTLAQKELSQKDAAILQPGATIIPTIDGHPQSVMILDEPTVTHSREDGTVIHCACRDWHSVFVDAQVDPRARFVPSMSLLDLITTAYTNINPNLLFVADSIANRNVITGRIYGQKTTKKGKVSARLKLGEENPYPNEGLFAFVSRVAQRFGLWIRPAADGKTIIIAEPDFGSPIRYGLQHALGADSVNNNTERGTFVISRKDQPSIIYASGFSGGTPNFATARLRAGVINPVVGVDNYPILNAYPDVPLVAIPALTSAFPPLVEEIPRAAFLYDAESHTQDQLEAYLRRELSLRMRKALSARYEIMGHKLNGQPVAIDTMVMVRDDVAPGGGWNGPLWVLGRSFKKDAKTGARTNLELLLPGSIVF
jgi:hypothetical protein